ncbi:MAG TPA: hypothetical protein VH458_20780 [Vicinamibacterales bacterium]|jgi:hypothetical protein
MRKLTASIVGGAAAMALTLQLGTIRAQADSRDHVTFVVDVAVDHATFAIVPSTGLVLQPEPAGPNRGTPFIVDGKVFAGGTLRRGAGQGDPNQAGSIGTWICKGIFTSDLATDDVGFNTTQMFQFNGDSDAIWTEGLEAGLGKIGVITHRTIVGGTGRFRGAEGEVVQEALGTNVTGTPNIRLTFKILKH